MHSFDNLLLSPIEIPSCLVPAIEVHTFLSCGHSPRPGSQRASSFARLTLLRRRHSRTVLPPLVGSAYSEFSLSALAICTKPRSVGR
jgi:hypothetical protein